MTTVVKVNSELVNEVQSRDVEAQVSQEIILKVLDMNKLDNDTTLISSPIFKAYEKEAAQKKIAFERAKNTMFNSSVSEDIKAKAKSWNLNYFTEELTIEM